MIYKVYLTLEDKLYPSKTYIRESAAIKRQEWLKKKYGYLGYDATIKIIEDTKDRKAGSVNTRRQ